MERPRAGCKEPPCWLVGYPSTWNPARIFYNHGACFVRCKPDQGAEHSYAACWKPDLTCQDGSSDSDDLSRRGVSLAGVYHEWKFTAESEPDGAVVEIRAITGHVSETRNYQ